MSISKAQVPTSTVCQCGCKEEFYAFPVYRKGGGGLRVPEYKRGHHPNCRKTQLGTVPVWNKGLNKDAVQSVGRQGKSGPQHWNYVAELNPDFFASDFDFVYYSRRYGKALRSKGGNKLYAKFRRAIMARDNYSCVDCGFVADAIEDGDLLHVHHCEFVKHNADRIFDPSNVVTLCYICHRKRHKRK